MAGPKSCDQCGRPISGKLHPWKLDGKSIRVCPACDSTIQRRVNSGFYKTQGNAQPRTRIRFVWIALAVVVVLLAAGAVLWQRGVLFRPAAEEVRFSLKDVALPSTLVSTRDLSLLNAAGKETRIPANTKIRVKERSDSGTLTMEVDGKLYVGKESRLAGNIRIPGATLKVAD